MTAVLKAELREFFGKKVNNLRKENKLPAVLYGWKEKESKPLVVGLKSFKKIWQEAGESGIVELKIGNDNKNVLIQDVQVNPVNNEPIHVDFYAVNMEESVVVGIPLTFEGEPPAAKQGGILVKVMHEVEIEALPKDLPSEIVVDVSSLAEFEDKITIADLKPGEGVKINAEPEDVVALIEEPKEEEEEVETPTIEEIEVVGKEQKEEKGGKEEPAKEEKEEKQEEKKKEKSE